jgi:hypothetical protein
MMVPVDAVPLGTVETTENAITSNHVFLTFVKSPWDRNRDAIE